MARITNEVLAEKIDSIHEIIKNDLKPAVKSNTEFRLQIKGILAGVGLISSMIGAGLMWITTWLFKK